MNKVVRAILSAVVVFIAVFAIDYVFDVFVHKEPFTPDWFNIIVSTILVALLTYFGPDAVQRKRNRQDLKDKFTGKR